MKELVLTAVAVALVGGATAAANDVACPVSDNVRGHENIEWSVAYAYGLTDATKDLPRVLLVGDSICNGYQSGVRELLKGNNFWGRTLVTVAFLVDKPEALAR